MTGGTRVSPNGRLEEATRGAACRLRQLVGRYITVWGSKRRRGRWQLFVT
jgi:hypothetical protein